MVNSFEHKNKKNSFYERICDYSLLFLTMEANKYIEYLILSIITISPSFHISMLLKNH